jgi:hypothetical protein
MHLDLFSFFVLSTFYAVVLAQLLKRLSLLYCIAFAPLSKISYLYLCGSTSGLYSVPFVYSLAILHYLDHRSFMVNHEVSVIPWTFFPSFNIMLHFLFVINLYIYFYRKTALEFYTIHIWKYLLLFTMV